MQLAITFLTRVFGLFRTVWLFVKLRFTLITRRDEEEMPWPWDDLQD